MSAEFNSSQLREPFPWDILFHQRGHLDKIFIYYVLTMVEGIIERERSSETWSLLLSSGKLLEEHPSFRESVCGLGSQGIVNCFTFFAS